MMWKDDFYAATNKVDIFTTKILYIQNIIQENLGQTYT